MTKQANGVIFRVHKNRKYTTISNAHLSDKKLSLKAKGLLSIMLAMPEDWNFSINGLATLSNDGRDSVLSAIKILQETGYLVLEKIRGENGHFNTTYNIYETPKTENNFTESEKPNRSKKEDRLKASCDTVCDLFQNGTESEKPIRLNRVGKTDTENPTETNILKLNTKNKRKEIKKEKKTYGEFQNVFLTDEHVEKLKKIYESNEDFEKAIGILSSYKESKKKTYKNDYAVLNKFNWVYEKIYPNSEQKTAFFNKPKTIAIPQGKSVQAFTADIPNYERASKW